MNSLPSDNTSGKSSSQQFPEYERWLAKRKSKQEAEQVRTSRLEDAWEFANDWACGEAVGPVLPELWKETCLECGLAVPSHEPESDLPDDWFAVDDPDDNFLGYVCEACWNKLPSP